MGKGMMKKMLRRIAAWKDKLNQNKNSKYINIYLGLISAACCGVLAAVMLFLSPALGVADDGTLAGVMTGAGVAYQDGVNSGTSHFVREYVWHTNQGTGRQTIQTFIIKFAKLLDYAFTGERSFDIRFLAAIYVVMLLPAVMLIVKAAAERLPRFSQKLIPTVGAVLMFGDMGYITYFNSFYPEALIFIFLLYMTGAALSFQKESRWEYAQLLLFVAACAGLCFVRQYCFIAGIAGMAFCLMRIPRQERKWKSAALIGAVLLAGAAIGSFLLLDNDFNQADKLHAMTRGVLMQSNEPEETLQEFGIDPSYSILTDISVYDEFPVTTGDNEALEEGFFSNYNTWDIVKYYVRHPNRMLAMLELSAKANMSVVRENCGNYEEAAQMPNGARSIFWSAYSIFKSRSLPKTMGYAAVLVIVLVAVTARGFTLKRIRDRKKTAFLQYIGVLVAFSVLTACFIIVQSGEAALVQYNGQFGMVTDILLFLAVTEIVELLNIL